MKNKKIDGSKHIFVIIDEFSKLDADIKYWDGEPCNHPGCRNHISHPCEVCGRIGARGFIYENPFDKLLIDL